MASISRAERLRALSKKARDDHAKLNAAPTPNPNLNFNNNSQLEDENSQLRIRMEHAEAEADDALAKATEAESVRVQRCTNWKSTNWPWNTCSWELQN